MTQLTTYLAALTLLLHVTSTRASFPAPSVDLSDGDCGGAVSTVSGDQTITSPSYPSRYPNNKLCVWLVTASAGKAVVITFPVCRVRCGGDFVAVWDGGEGSTDVAAAFCGSQDGTSVQTVSNQMTVVFYSNRRQRNQGFSATVTEIDPYGSCGRPTIARVPAPTKIVGGNTASHGSWPWQALVRSWAGTPGTGSYWLCGGTLVDSQWVVTAAHCIKDGILPEVTLGEHDRWTSDGSEESIFASQTFLHPDYDTSANTSPHDIALIKLSSPVTYNDYIMPACLPEAADVIAAGTMVTVSGWGLTEDDGSTARLLQQMDVPIVSDSNCELIYGSQVDISVDLCAGYILQGGIDSCSGDSGGPLVSETAAGEWVLHGVVSRGVRPCASPFTPSIYARVTGLVDWLTDTMDQN